ncbi:MAG TPA: hypothetical protein VIJ19_03590 [Opitutaceae bacterium]
MTAAANLEGAERGLGAPLISDGIVQHSGAQRQIFERNSGVGGIRGWEIRHRPHAPTPNKAVDYLNMNTLLLVIVLLLVFGGGGFYIGGPAFGGGGLGLVLLICLIIYLMGGFRTKT